MEYIIFGIVAAVFILFVFIKGYFDERKLNAYLRKKFRNEYGNKPEREYKLEQFQTIPTYFKKHIPDVYIDDITWNDLDMDQIFKDINHTKSSAGEEYLYYMLRTPKLSEEELLKREDKIKDFMNDEQNRVELQFLLYKAGKTGKYSLYDYLEYLDKLGKRSNWKDYLIDFLYIPAIIWAFFAPAQGILAIVILIVYNIASYFKIKGEINPYLTSFAYIGRLLDNAKKMEKLKVACIDEERKILKRNLTKFNSFSKNAYLVLTMNSPTGKGNPIEALIDGLRMMLHVDLIKFNKMLAVVQNNTDEIDELVSVMGSIDALISVAYYRASLGDYCEPRFIENDELEITELYHPMLKDPIKNSFHTQKGILLTGSNASGKSTFLKSVALAALLAQTIHTCPAKTYKGEYYEILSSMSLRDSITSGESYYIVEIKSIKRILNRCHKENHKVLCFVDEVLRGTNTVERIAASSQILKSLANEGILCFAATHDIELTCILKNFYHNYHFEEEIINGDILFNYKLLNGKATTRNAIKLLELIGYDNSITESAQKMAEEFLDKGTWEEITD